MGRGFEKLNDLQSDFQFFEDVGCEHVDKMSGWMYFRKTIQQDGRTEIYSDVSSKVQKDHRLMTCLAIFLPIFVILSPDPGNGYYGVLGPVVLCLYLGLFLLWAFAIVKSRRRIVELKKTQSL
ncbi:MAG: DUF2812 domain-containing protein [Anaerolineales bacterium]